MSYYKILGFALLAATAVLILRKVKDEYAILVLMATGIGLMGFALSVLEPVFTYFESFLHLSENTAVYLPLMFKAFGLALLTSVASDLCKDSGERVLSDKIELCGKSVILCLCLPLIQAVTEYVFLLVE